MLRPAAADAVAGVHEGQGRVSDEIDDALGAPAQFPLVHSPTRGRWLIAAVLLSLVIVIGFAVTMPFARLSTGRSELFLPAYAAGIFLLELMTAVLLMALFNLRRSPALLLLSSGYLFSALLVPAWVLSFPGVFAPFGIELGLQFTAAIAAARRIGFPLFVLAYALAPRTSPLTLAPGRSIAAAVFLVMACVAFIMVAVFLNRPGLPSLMMDARNVGPLWHMVPAATLALYGLAIVILLTRHRSQLDIWVALVVFSLTIELLLISYLGGGVRLSVGWWAGRTYGLLAASIVLMVLLVESIHVYGRLAQTVAAERRARRGQMTAVEALSASIAHEINQPLTSMITNANAGLRWLLKDEPRLDRAQAAFRHIVEDGHRASSIVTGIRSMFMKGRQERTELDMNALAEAAVQAARSEALQEFIEVRDVFAPHLPTVVGNAAQLGHVMRNLIENAVDSVRSGRGWPRRVIIRTWVGEGDEVRVSVEDNGPGIAPEVADRLFDPFVTTKAGGMGMGLMFCRAVVEAHGGRLWATSEDGGAAFHFSLPSVMFAGHDQG